jgi:hypothetical protein
MIDIHPPHHAAATRRDFFIHLSTVVLGILIAIGLEQAVEYLHHRHQLQEARAALAEEHQENIARYHLNVRDHLLRTANNHTDQIVLRFLLAHPGTPEEKLPAAMAWGPPTLEEPVESAWLTLQHSDVASLFPPGEMRAYSAEYTQLEREANIFHILQGRLAACASYLTHTADVTTLSSDEQNQTLTCEVLAQSEEAVYGDQLSVIGEMKDFGPPIGWWAMIPFFHMNEAHEAALHHTAANAVTKANQDAALSVLPPDQRILTPRQSSTSLLGPQMYRGRLNRSTHP